MTMATVAVGGEVDYMADILNMQFGTPMSFDTSNESPIDVDFEVRMGRVIDMQIEAPGLG